MDESPSDRLVRIKSELANDGFVGAHDMDWLFTSTQRYHRLLARRRSLFRDALPMGLTVLRDLRRYLKATRQPVRPIYNVETDTTQDLTAPANPNLNVLDFVEALERRRYG